MSGFIEARTPAAWRANLQFLISHDRLKACANLPHASVDDEPLPASLVGAIGPSVQSAADCPESVMPRWLAELVSIVGDSMADTAAMGQWGLDLASALSDVQWDEPARQMTLADGMAPVAIPPDGAPTDLAEKTFNFAAGDVSRWNAVAAGLLNILQAG